MLLSARKLSLFLLAAVLLMAVFVAACGGDEKDTVVPATAAPTTAPSVPAAAPASTAAPTPESAGVEIGHMVGQEGADFTLTSVDGEEITLSSLRGSPVVLYYFATW